MKRLSKALFSFGLILSCLYYPTPTQALTPLNSETEDLERGEGSALYTHFETYPQEPSEAFTSNQSSPQPYIIANTESPQNPAIENQVPWNPKFRIGTDAVGLLLLQVNLEPEIDFLRHWSFAIPVYYSAWDYFRSDIKFRTFSVFPEIRYWFKSTCKGLYLGAHFGLSYFNYAFGGKWRYQDHNRRNPALGGGISVGYRMSLDEKKHWNLTVSAGIGIYHLHYDKFLNVADGKLLDTINKTRFLPDHLSVTFSYSFGMKRKGGNR